MQKVKILVASIVLVASILTSSMALQKQPTVKQPTVSLVSLKSMEALAVAESGGSTIIVCNCDKGWIPNKKCLVTNDDRPCAQSQPGGNINCQSFNSNCGGTNVGV